MWLTILCYLSQASNARYVSVEIIIVIAIGTVAGQKLCCLLSYSMIIDATISPDLDFKATFHKYKIIV